MHTDLRLIHGKEWRDIQSYYNYTAFYSFAYILQILIRLQKPIGYRFSQCNVDIYKKQ